MKKDYESIVNEATRTFSKEQKRQVLVSAGVVNAKTGKTEEKYKSVYCYKGESR